MTSLHKARFKCYFPDFFFFFFTFYIVLTGDWHLSSRFLFLRSQHKDESECYINGFYCIHHYVGCLSQAVLWCIHGTQSQYYRIRREGLGVIPLTTPLEMIQMKKKDKVENQFKNNHTRLAGVCICCINLQGCFSPSVVSCFLIVWQGPAGGSNRT